MEEESSSWRLINDHLKIYLDRARDIGSEKEMKEQAYSTLKDLLIVEIYFMGNVRQIVTDDEMSGFILYLDTRLKSIINQYDPSKSSFRTYMSIAIERKACTYRSELKRKDQFETCYNINYLPYESFMVSEEPSAEDYFMTNQSNLGNEIGPIERLRYICAMNPLRQKRLFIFLCTLLPYLSAEMIDQICTLLNFDKNQTYAIADYLFLRMDTVNRRRNNLRYIGTRNNIFWIRSIELENAIRIGNSNQKLSQKLKYNKAMLKKTTEMASTMKKRVSYPEIGRVLNIKESMVAAAVFDSKRILQFVADSNSKVERSVARIFRCMDNQILKAKVELFEPFKEFCIASEIDHAPRLNTCSK